MVKEQKEVKKITAGLIFSWIFGVLFLFAGMGLISQGSYITGILVMVCSAMIIPYFNKMASEKFHFQISGGIKFILVIIIFGLIGIGMSNLEDFNSNIDVQPTTTSSSDDGTKSTQEEVKQYSIGDSVQAGDFRWKITKFTIAQTIGSNPYLTTEANGVYLIIDVEVENTGSSAKYLTDSYLKLVDDKNREFSPDSSAAFYLDSNQALLFELVNPGIVKKGKIVFDVPENLDVVNFRISSNLLSSSVYNVKLVI